MSEINSIKPSAQQVVGTTRNNEQRDAGKPQGAQASETHTDTVNLTDTATQMQSLQKAIANSSEVDTDRVQALRAAIADGSYKVDSHEVAQNMINFEQNLK